MYPSYTGGSYTMGQVANSGNAMQQATMGNAMQYTPYSNPYLRNAWNVAANKAPEREAALKNAWISVQNKAPESQSALQNLGYNSFTSPYSFGGGYNMASMQSASR